MDPCLLTAPGSPPSQNLHLLPDALNRVSTTPIATRSPAHALALRDLEAFDSGGAGCRHDRSPRRPSCRTLVDLDRAVRASAPRSAALPPPVEPINGDSRESDHGGRGADSRVNLEYCLVSVSHKIHSVVADRQDELHGRQLSYEVGDPEMAKLEWPLEATFRQDLPPSQVLRRRRARALTERGGRPGTRSR